MASNETFPPEHAFKRCGFRSCTALVVGGLLLSISSPALALPEAPGVIIEELGDLGLDCTPTCTLCHTSLSADSQNAVRPIAVNLIAFRTPGPISVPFTAENLPIYLEALRTQPCAKAEDVACANGMPCKVCDGDGDGVGDIAELIDDSDPNLPDAKLACPQYGCGAHIAPERPRRPLDGTTVLAALGAAAVLVRRIRRR